MGSIGRRDFMRVAGTAAVGATVMMSSRGEAAPANSAFSEAKRIPLTIDNPSALAVMPGGGICVAGENAVAILDVQGNETARFGVKGRPGCVAVAADKKLLVGMRNHVEVIDMKDSAVASWQELGDRAYLTSVVVDDENVYVADAGNRVVLRFGYDGILRGRIGERDKKRGLPGRRLDGRKPPPGLVVPSPYFDVAIDPQGALWVVNPGKHGLENYRPNGELVSSWYRSGMEPEAFCGCCNPTNLAITREGLLVTSEKGIPRVKVYDRTGKMLAYIPPRMFSPDAAGMDLAVDSKDRIYVAEPVKGRVMVFALKKSGK